MSSSCGHQISEEQLNGLPSHQSFCIDREMDIIRKTKGLTPMSNLDVRFIGLFATEWRIPTEAFEHDRAKTPPVALFPISFARKYLRCDIVWRTHRRICHLSSIVSPHCQNSFPILRCHSKIDRVYGDRLTTRLRV